MAPDARQRLGAAGEDAVAAWYERAGYQVLDRNWRCREGELDLVLVRAGEVVFCEVKTRRSTAYGEPMEAVTPSRSSGVCACWRTRWLAEHPVGRSRDLRFDVASVLAPRGITPTIDVIEAAF